MSIFNNIADKLRQVRDRSPIDYTPSTSFRPLLGQLASRSDNPLIKNIGNTLFPEQSMSDIGMNFMGPMAGAIKTLRTGTRLGDAFGGRLRVNSSGLKIPNEEIANTAMFHGTTDKSRIMRNGYDPGTSTYNPEFGGPGMYFSPRISEAIDYGDGELKNLIINKLDIDRPYRIDENSNSYSELGEMMKSFYKKVVGLPEEISGLLRGKGNVQPEEVWESLDNDEYPTEQAIRDMIKILGDKGYDSLVRNSNEYVVHDPSKITINPMHPKTLRRLYDEQSDSLSNILDFKYKGGK